MIANPPVSLDEWGRDVAESDGCGRFRFGVPPKTKGDLAFVQHMVAVLNTSGGLGVVMPHGVLFRRAAEGKIRQGLLQEDLFEAVIGLAPNLFYGTGIPASILVLNRDKPPPRQGKVLFIDASGEFEEGSNQNRLHDQDLARIARTFHAFADVEKIRACRTARRARAKRLEPEHQPLRGHVRRGAAHRCRRGGAEAPRTGERACRRRSRHEPVPGGVGVRPLTICATPPSQRQFISGRFAPLTRLCSCQTHVPHFAHVQ